MGPLALACAFFLFIHLIISGTSMKDGIIGKIGGIAYYVLFSLLSLGGLIWMCVAFAGALNDPLNHVFWAAPLFMRVIALVGNFFAFFFVVLGYSSPSPTKLGALLKMPDKTVYGVSRITRHPILAGIALWALMHMLCNGNMAAWLFFGTLFALCILGANNIDRKRLALMGDVYASIKRRTSIIPFVAIIEGRTAFAPEELGVARMLLATSLYSVFAVLHEMLFTVKAL